MISCICVTIPAGRSVWNEGEDASNGSGWQYTVCMSTSRLEPAKAVTPTIPRDHLGALIVAVLMMAIGWLGLAEVVRHHSPSIRSVFQLLLLLFVASSGTAMPFVFYANVRFVPLTKSVPASGVIVRQSAWVGFFVVGCACLQLMYIGDERALNPWTALLLASILILLEWGIRRRELGN